jgi:hypothetical protein
LAGGYLNFASSSTGGTTGNSLLFDFGAKFGIHVSNLDFSWLSFALGYDYVSDSSSGTSGLGLAPSRSYHDLNLQALLTRIGETGFYLGPAGGLVIVPSSSIAYPGTSSSTSYFEAGAVGGYEYFFSRSFSIGPDVRFQHLFTSDVLSTAPANVLKFTLQLGLHF